MPGFAITGTNHTSFTVSDLDRSVAFFCEALGFTLLNKSPRDPAAIRRITGIEGADIVVPELLALEGLDVVPFHAGETLRWRLKA